MQYLTTDGLHRLLERLGEEYDVLAPVRTDGRLAYERFSKPERDVIVGEVRAVEPLKAFFFPARERVAEGFSPETPNPRPKPLCVVGAKACDLKGLAIQDHVFKGGDTQDPFYAKAREANLIIAADCTCALDTCFCLAVDVKPFPQEDYDIALASLNGGFAVEVGSQKGEELVRAHAPLFQEAPEDLQQQRDEQRARVRAEVEGNIAANEIPDRTHLSGAVAEKFHNDLWADEAGACVECGACNTVCPTCHCFFLFDQADKTHMARVRLWDSCLVKDFARVAGGANPRPELWMRLRNRFEKKFDFFPKTTGVYACTGCGRCISACPAKIDIRRVLKRLVSDA